MSDILTDPAASADILNDPGFTEEVAGIVTSSSEPKTVQGAFRKAELPLPPEVRRAPGIKLYNHLVRSLVFSTDLVIIKNCDADAVLAVYPFTCQPSITQALLTVSERPVITGVAGATTTGVRSVLLAAQSEMQGASGVAVNLSTKPVVIRNIARSVDIPVILTIDRFDAHAQLQINAGARIVNVAAGKDTPKVVERVRAAYPDMPLIASGGGSGESILRTISAGADAVTWTPPSMQELERATMAKNRAKVDDKVFDNGPLHRIIRNE